MWYSRPLREFSLVIAGALAVFLLMPTSAFAAYQPSTIPISAPMLAQVSTGTVNPDHGPVGSRATSAVECDPANQYTQCISLIRSQELDIPGFQPWTDTGIDIPSGAQVRINASGVIKYSGADPGTPPSGIPDCIAGGRNSPPGSFLVPGLACVSLVGRIGNGQPFAVGNGTTVTAEAAGRLFLGVNDNYFEDNSGSWTVSVDAPKIVDKYAQSVTVTTFDINWPVCFDKDQNPLGYILHHTTYVGWSFIDSNGAVGDAWYRTWDNGWKTVSGPAIVDKQWTTSECGLPQ